MGDTLADLRVRAIAVRDACAELASRFTAVGDALAVDGSLPEGAALEALTGDVGRQRAAFVAIKERTLTVPGAGDMDGQIGAATSVDALLAAIDAAIAACEERRATVARLREQALEVLSSISALCYPGRPDFRPLVAPVARARLLRDEVSDAPDATPDMRDLATGEHPFARLLRLVVENDALDEDALGALQADVEANFDRLLAVAAVRGRLGVGLRRENRGIVTVRPESPGIADSVEGGDARPIVATPTGTPAAEGDKNEGQQGRVSDHDLAARPLDSVPDSPLAEQPARVAISANPTDDTTISTLASGDVRTSTPTPALVEEVGVVNPTRSGDSATETTPANRLTGATMPGAVVEPVPDAVVEPVPDAVVEPVPDAVVEPVPDAVVEPVPDLAGDSTPEMTAEGAAPVLTELEQPATVGDEDRATAPSIGGLATQLVEQSASASPAVVSALLWLLIADGAYGLAFHLSAHRGEDVSPPAWAIKALALGRQVRYDDGALARALVADFAHVPGDAAAAGDDPADLALRLGLSAAALRAALLAPHSGAPAVLQSLHLGAGQPAYAAFCRRLAVYGDEGLPLDPQALRPVMDHTAWQDKMGTLRDEVEAWWRKASQYTILYAPATKVWHKWFERGHIMYNLLQPIRDGDTDRGAEVGRLVMELSRDEDLDAVVRHTDRVILRRRHGDDIIARARNRLRGHVDDALSYARRWLDLQGARPGLASDYRQQRAAELALDVAGRCDAVEAELASAATTGGTPHIVGLALDVCRDAVGDIQMLFDPENAASAGAGREPDLTSLLGVDLLSIPSLPVNDAWSPETEGRGTVYDAIVAQLAAGLPTLRGALVARADQEHRDIDGAERILALLADREPDASDLGALRQDIDRQLRDYQGTLRREASAARKDVETFFVLGLLQEAERAAYVAEITDMESNLTGLRRFLKPTMRLHAISGEMATRREAEITRLRHRLDEDLGVDHPAYARIAAVLDRGDALTANEYIHGAQQGEPLPVDDGDASPFDAFFPGAYRDIEAYLEQPGPGGGRPDLSHLVTEMRVLAKGRRRDKIVGPIDMGRVGGSQADEAADMLQAWIAAKRGGHRINSTTARTILTALGFNVRDARVDSTSGRAWIVVHAETIADPKQCPIYVYGSKADGHYNVLCTWDRPTEDALLADTRESPSAAPVLVWHFGRMTEPRRRDLARACREERRSLLVVDDTVMLRLCAERGLRLPALFAYTMPFTVLDPYVTSGGLVPPELFYGRQREREAIINPMGSCLIYGGRQLGKTALLRDVVRAFHAPSRGQVALYVNLNAEGVGKQRRIDELWTILAKELKTLDVLPATMPAHASEDRVREHIQEWLGQDARRRLLLLLDEADIFLESDAKAGFARVDRIKGLMDRTGRRFKVVFAGLHNVLRTATQGNHPLAHYGEPICIGPLLANGEWRAARRLVELPLVSLGYRFESPDLVTRILSQTNYYPNLIQLYCNQLLRHLTDAHVARFDARATPPYTITARHVDDAYQDQDLRRNIRDRLDLTLQLDERYKVIAYTMAFGVLAGEVDGLVEGVHLAWIKDKAIGWWPDGFKESVSDDMFRTLLDEMVGLGVFRRAGEGLYALRSPSVVSLLGGQEEIANALLAEHDQPDEYEPSWFRSIMRVRDMEDPWVSPLTAQQMAALQSHANDVSIICGSAAAGLDEVVVALRDAFGDFFEHVQYVLSLRAFETRLSTLNEREKDGTTLWLVDASCTWNEQWVEEARRRLGRLTSKTSFARIAFVADPVMLWDIAGQPRERAVPLETHGLFLGPWHDVALRGWLQECGVGPGSPIERHEVARVTGNWPALLRLFYDRVQPDKGRWRERLSELDEAMGGREEAHRLLARLGLESSDRRHALLTLADLADDASADALSTLADGLDRAGADRVLRWANDLRLVTPAGNGVWRVDPIVERLLRATAPQR